MNFPPKICRLRAACLALLTAAMAFLPGCKKAEQSDAVAVTEAKASLQKAFATASPDLKAVAAEAAAGLDAGDSGKAFLQLNQISGRSDLTAEQRGAAVESMLAAGKKLREAAARGDKDAAQVLDAYRAGK